MKKTILLVCLVIGSLRAADKKPKPDDQPTLEEKFVLLRQQRDALVKEIAQLKAVEEAKESLILMQSSAVELAIKYDCSTFRPDLSCVKKTKEEKKEEKEAEKGK